MTASTPEAPYTPSDPREFLHVECDCIPDEGPSHCHLCDRIDMDGEVEWPCAYAEAMAAHDAEVSAKAWAEGVFAKSNSHPSLFDRDVLAQNPYTSKESPNA